uniref:Uncharacterized protein n=1 Tax=viral metagenome TaxID=1070528 RepID=A0A6M3LIN1_9ZZZZ
MGNELQHETRGKGRMSVKHPLTKKQRKKYIIRAWKDRRNPKKVCSRFVTGKGYFTGTITMADGSKIHVLDGVLLNCGLTDFHPSSGRKARSTPRLTYHYTEELPSWDNRSHKQIFKPVQ